MPLIGLEGPDGCGKGTQLKLLLSALTRQSVKVRSLAFPDRSTLSGKLIDRFLKGTTRAHKRVDGDDQELEAGIWKVWVPDEAATAEALQCAMIVNRLEVVPQIVEAQQAGYVVIFDRYTDSGIVYGAADGISSTWLTQVQSPLPQLDLHILLDVDTEDSFRRRPERQEMYEANRERMARVCVGYREWWKLNHKVDPDRWVTIDARRIVEEVHADVLSAVRRVLH